MNIPGTILLNALAGSHAYGLNIATSDEDYRGVYAVDKADFYALNFPAEVSDETNDRSYFELSKFSELLFKNNPTVLELLAYPERCIREKHPAFDLFKPEDYLTKHCQNSFTGYALGQIRKAYNLKKRISIPADQKQKTPLDFCKVMVNGTSVSFHESAITDEGYSATELEPEKGLFALWKNPSGSIVFNEDIYLVNKQKGEKLAGYMLFDRAAYSKHAKEYKSFYLWRKERDSKEKVRGGKEYDGKFMMHTFRLLYTAKDIATKGEIILERPEKQHLLSIRNQEFEFNPLIREAEDLVEEVRALFRTCGLPEEVNSNTHYERVAEIRNAIYLKK
ncbi:MAG: nucleotidyltransferase domain-containing protein [Flavobacteriales bacterium]